MEVNIQFDSVPDKELKVEFRFNGFPFEYRPELPGRKSGLVVSIYTISLLRPSGSIRYCDVLGRKVSESRSGLRFRDVPTLLNDLLFALSNHRFQTRQHVGSDAVILYEIIFRIKRETRHKKSAAWIEIRQYSR